ncbi:MAG: hypothetical protein AAGA42_08025 [Actinomycetota bacterium]
MEQEHIAPAVRDRGVSAVEVIIAIVLIGTVVVAALNAMFTSISASTTSQNSAQVETAIVNAADRVNRAPKSCDYTRFAQAAVQIEGWPETAASVTHEYYVPGASALQGDEGAWVTGAAPSCPAQPPETLIVQRVTIQITHPDGSVSRSIQVVKSDV